MPEILIVDDEERMRRLLSIMLERRGFRVDQAGDGEQALNMLSASNYDMVISDIKMPRMDGLTLIKKIREMDIPCPLIFITAFATVESSVEAMKLGAVDYIIKPFDEDRIIMTVERTLNISKIMAENKELRTELGNRDASECEIVFSSRQMADVIDMAKKVAATGTTVLITGESGTGKELLAGFIHRISDRANKRFVALNCAAISSQLVEAELFGYEKGAFTGADKRKQGKFEFVDSGTLFLDEIGDLPVDSQAKLLRALQEKKITRVGGNDEIPVDVRLICATNRNLEDMVESGAFRNDLFFRINVFPLHMPALRDRIEDVVPIANHFLKKQGTGQVLTADAEKVLTGYSWPGNVRELGNVIERAVILSKGSKTIDKGFLSFLNTSSLRQDKSVFTLPETGINLEEFEANLVKQALALTGNNQSAAAKLLGLTRAKFRVLLKQS